MKTLPVPENRISAFLFSVLSEELEITDNSRFLRLAAADLEERNDPEHRNDTHADNRSDRNNNGNSENNRNNAEQNIHNGELERLTNMESGIIRLVRRKQRDDDADGAEQIAKHCDDLVIRDILRVEFSGMIKRIGACRRSLCGIEAVAAGRAENNVILALSAAFGTEFHKLATSHSKFSYIKYIMYIRRSQYT